MNLTWVSMNWFKSFWEGMTTPMSRAEQESLEGLNNFTPGAQQVLALARREADRFNHNFVGTEHLLLALIVLDQALNVPGKMGLNLENVRLEVEKQVGTGPDEKMIGNIPYTPRVKKCLALAAKVAKTLNHTYVGTEHIQLALLREGEGVARRVLTKLGVDIEAIREDIDFLALAQRFFSPRERDALRSVPREKRRDAFFACWTRKEAYIKARGMGLSMPLGQFDVSLMPGEPARLLETRDDPDEAARWRLQALYPGQGFAGALVVDQAVRHIHCWQWPDAGPLD